MGAKHLLIVYHTQSGNTGRMADAAYAGATDEMVENIEVKLVRAKDAGPEDLLWAHGLLIGTPENFGYMSGAMKDFLDRTFPTVEQIISRLYKERTQPPKEGPFCCRPCHKAYMWNRKYMAARSAA